VHTVPRRRAALTIASLLASGCSWIFMKKPPESVAVPQVAIECTSSRVAPGFDVAGTVYFVANAIALLARRECTGFNSDCVEKPAKIGGSIVSAALAITYAAAAHSGFESASRCEQVKDLNARCLGGSEADCRALNASWVPPPAGPDWPPESPYGSGCSKDTDCKGDRICVAAVCVDPTEREKAPPPAPKAAPPDPGPPKCERTIDCEEGICIDGRCRH